MTEQNIYLNGSHKVLPANSHVKPIEPNWLPAHLKNTSDYKFFRPEKEVFVYCHFGIVVIPLSNMRRVN